MGINGLTKRLRFLLAAGAVATALWGQPETAFAQDTEEEEDQQPVLPSTAFVLSGYGTVGWAASSGEGGGNLFTANFNPIFLFQFEDRFLFEAEFEFELQGGVTETGLEYAQLDVIATDFLVFVGGKFLLPFNVFGERLHPTWINKFPTAPPIYGHHIAGFGADPLLPILSDLGIMARAAATPGRWLLGASAYVSQGPALEEHEEEEGGEEHPEAELPEVGFPASSGDNNKNKALGLRLDLALPPWMEVNFSVLNGDYDEEGLLDFTAYGVSAEARTSGFEFRGEYIQTRQEIETEEGFPELVRNGFYAQAAYRWWNFEPVLRWTQIFNSELQGEKEEDGARQMGFGLNYWLTASIAIMAGYELNRESGLALDNDRFIIHAAYGF
jgi:hypothetical protein